MVINTAESLFELFNRVCEALEVAGLLERHDETLMVTNSCYDLFPLLDEWSSAIVRQVVRDSKICRVTPDSQLIDRFSDSDFTLSLVTQIFDIFDLVNECT